MFERESKFDVWLCGALAAFYAVMTVVYGASGRWGWALAWAIAAGLFGWLAHKYHQRNLEIAAIRAELSDYVDKYLRGELP